MAENIDDLITNLEGPMLLGGSVIFAGLGYTTSESYLTSGICYAIGAVFAGIFVGLKYDRKKELEQQKKIYELEQIFD